jgi:hyaluronan synthase
MRQQLRWKKSWIRETLKGTRYFWKKHPVTALFFYIGAILRLLAPVIVVRTFLWLPYFNHSTPMYYLLGLLLMALIYGLYYYLHTGDRRWVYGVFGVSVAYLVLIWQIPYAFLRLRDSRWGTR